MGTCGRFGRFGTTWVWPGWATETELDGRIAGREAGSAVGGTRTTLVDDEEWGAVFYGRGFASRLGRFRDVRLGRNQYRDGEVVFQPAWKCYITVRRREIEEETDRLSGVPGCSDAGARNLLQRRTTGQVRVEYKGNSKEKSDELHFGKREDYVCK